MKKARSYSRTEKSKIWRFSLIGAGIFGALGFVAGVALCLHYQLPIPPLFLTELSGLVGGCLGALLALHLCAVAREKSRSMADGWYENTDLY